MNGYVATIGIEVHCQLSTESKIFCSCSVKAGMEPNVNTCPICAGHPGTLPVLNAKAVEYAVKAGLALGCSIRDQNVFARKNYFYPDLPKGYQISQYDLPICENGALEIETSKSKKRVRIQRIHLEEDAGKNVHGSGYSLIDLNRAGVPLIEIVTCPDLETPEEAGAYLRGLHAIVTYLGICDGNMQEGNFRCDANVSVRPKGTAELGTRCEIKNVNSFRFVEKAIEFEISRQTALLQSGGKVVQETRGYDSAKNMTYSMRSKEEAQDYRYFPDPDLIPVSVATQTIERLRKALPELPAQKRERYASEYGLTDGDAGVLTAIQAMTVFFEETLRIVGAAGAKTASNFLTGEITRLVNEDAIELGESKLKPSHLADLVKLVQANVVSSTGAKQALGEAWRTGEVIDAIVERLGLKQVSDISSLEPAIDRVLAANPSQVAEIKAGKEKVIGFLVGQVMKATGGKANPALVQELIKKKIS